MSQVLVVLAGCRHVEGSQCQLYWAVVGSSKEANSLPEPSSPRETRRSDLTLALDLRALFPSALNGGGSMVHTHEIAEKISELFCGEMYMLILGTRRKGVTRTC